MKNLASIIWEEKGEVPDNLNTFQFTATWENYQLMAMLFIQDNVVFGISITFTHPNPNVRPLRSSDINQCERFLGQIKRYKRIIEFEGTKIFVKSVPGEGGARIDAKNKFVW